MEKYKNYYDNSKSFAEKLQQDLHQKTKRNEEAKNKKSKKL
jgi:hypothetical protein